MDILNFLLALILWPILIALLGAICFFPLAFITLFFAALIDLIIHFFLWFFDN